MFMLQPILPRELSEQTHLLFMQTATNYKSNTSQCAYLLMKKAPERLLIHEMSLFFVSSDFQ
jgi:hypothetical protein